MYQCVFYTTRYKRELVEKFQGLKDEMELKDSFDVTQNESFYRLVYPSKETNHNVIELSAHIISDIIQKEGILQTTKAYLQQRKDLPVHDKKEIERKFVNNNYLSTQEGFSALVYYLVYIPVLSSLKEHQEINIDGWLRFRTSRYKIILEDILEQFVEDYLVKKGIIKVIKMIREISQFNDPLEETLHLIYSKDGEASILNELMEEVTVAYINKYCKELFADSSLNKEDLIMNILITVSPRRIVVHQKENAKYPRFIKTLEGIFGLNIEYCQGCPYCTQPT